MGFNFLSLCLQALAILPCVRAITPKQMLSAPRRSSAVPNSSGKLAVFSVSQYSFETHTQSSWWSLLDIATGDISLLTNDSNVSEVVWLGTSDTDILYINGTNSEIDGGIELWVADVTAFDSGYKAASIGAPLSGLKSVVTSSGDVNFLLSGLAFPNGTAYNEELVPTPYSTARIYDTIYVRHWDTYLTAERYAVFGGVLSGLNSTKFSLSGDVKNLLGDIGGLESPVQPFGGSEDYDISPDGSSVVFLSKDPALTQANHTASYIYFVPHDASAKPIPINGPASPGTPANARGASGSPVFSPDGKAIVYVQQDEDVYESDKNKLYIAGASPNTTSIRGVATEWDHSPGGAIWSADGSTLYLLTEEHAREKIFVVSSSAGVNATPVAITNEGAVGSASLLPDGNLLITSNSFFTSNSYSIISPSGNSTKELFVANKVDPELAGLTDENLDEFWFEGAKTQVHAFIVKPTGFSANKTYPLAYLVHGGPQGAWDNTWSTRWNPAVWADQGYVVVLVDFTGSTGYGKEFTDDIRNDWGGKPYIDLVKGWEYVAENISYIDTANGIEAGASFGGYMTNWIQGQPLGKKFKALVTHDGIFSTLGQYSSEELWFPQHDFNGTLWNNRENYLRWDPASHAINFTTPHFVVHNELDYRLPVAEGIALFNVLQERGVPSRFLNFPDENHWVLKPENNLVWHREVLGWVNKYSGVNGGVVNLS